ncbi:MAG TPA: glycosyltransferase family 4 protein [Planctomycetota bacterium]|nr:glycosyltransferase family 4 protein [Planctomycetota bacterium]
MRILYAHRTRARDGSAVHIRSLVEAFRARGHEVLEVSPPIRGGGGTVLERPGGLRRAAREAAEYAYIPYGAWRLLRAARAFRPDFLYQRYAFADASGILAAGVTSRPLVLEVNSPLARELHRTRGLLLPGLGARVERTILRRASRLAVVSGVLRDEVEGWGVERSRILLTPNGVDLARFRPDLDGAGIRKRLGLPAEGVLGFVGYLRPWHRLDLVLEAMATPGLRGARLLVVGEGPARGALEERARAAGLAERVLFTGEVAHAEVPLHVAAFDVALLPAINPYASPLKIFEYLACAKAVVAPRQRNVEEIVRDEREALLFPPEDPLALARAIARLLDDPGARAALGRAGRERLLAGRFTWEGNVERVERSLAPLLSGARPQAAGAGGGGGGR